MRSRLSDSWKPLCVWQMAVVVEFVDRDPTIHSANKGTKRVRVEQSPAEIEIEPRTFSFNAPYGSCTDCDGIGYKVQVSANLVVPDEDLSIDDGAIVPWSVTASGPARDYHMRQLEGLGEELGFSTKTKWKNLATDAKDAILNGSNFKVKMKYRNRWGREKIYSTGFEAFYIC